MQIEMVSAKSLTPADYNPRKISAKQRAALRNSLDEFGFVQPIIVNRLTGVIVGGHQRLTAALAIGLEEVPVVYVELTADREKALNVALNKISGDWDYELLVDVLRDIEDGPEFDLTGFDIDEFQAIERALAKVNKAGREGKVPPPPRVPLSRAGEVYQLGRHVLVIGDSTDPASYAHTHERARMMFTDPPYNIAYEGGTDEKLTIMNDGFDSSAAYRDFLVAFLLAAHTKNAGVSYVCYASPESEAVHAAWRLANYHHSSEIHQAKPADARKGASRADVVLWDKDGFTLGRGHYHQGHEPILYGWHPKADRRYWCGDRTQSNVWVYPKPARNADHPTMKPVDLVERAIRNSSEPGDWVLDPFGGSGSTLVAAENIGRRCYTIELDPRFADVIIRRYLSLDPNEPVERTVSVEDSSPEGWWTTPTNTTESAEDDE